ncbi:MAG: polysaccharide biosynthesis/export family protein [Pyrinomonadaceae bacterium]
MKKAPLALSSVLAVMLLATSGFAQSDRRQSTPQTNNGDSTIRTSRVVGPGRSSNHVVNSSEARQTSGVTLAATTSRSTGNHALPTEGSRSSSEPAWGNAAIIRPAIETSIDVSPATAEASVSPSSLTRIYRVGVGDVLDIRLLNTPTHESTLFTVLPGGLVEYPLIDGPLKVVGLSAEEIAARLTGKIKVIADPRVVVSVRDHSSHNVIVTGLVYSPGSKVLRQEAVPLYVVLAEAVARPGAARATIGRAGQSIAVDLGDQAATSTLLFDGDMVTVSTAPPSSYYVSGEINSPGEKTYHAGLTLTQAILASGGITRKASGKVKISSTTAGKASTADEYNVKEILEGRKPDPMLKPGDRLEIIHGRW